MITREMIEEFCKGSTLGELVTKVYADMVIEQTMRESEYWQWLAGEKNETDI